jgi:hypothetical protein
MRIFMIVTAVAILGLATILCLVFPRYMQNLAVRNNPTAFQRTPMFLWHLRFCGIVACIGFTLLILALCNNLEHGNQPGAGGSSTVSRGGAQSTDRPVSAVHRKSSGGPSMGSTSMVSINGAAASTGWGCWKASGVNSWMKSQQCRRSASAIGRRLRP